MLISAGTLAVINCAAARLDLSIDKLANRCCRECTEQHTLMLNQCKRFGTVAVIGRWRARVIECGPAYVLTYEIDIEQGSEQLFSLGKGAPNFRGGER